MATKFWQGNLFRESKILFFYIYFSVLLVLNNCFVVLGKSRNSRWPQCGKHDVIPKSYGAITSCFGPQRKHLDVVSILPIILLRNSSNTPDTGGVLPGSQVTFRCSLLRINLSRKLICRIPSCVVVWKECRISKNTLPGEQCQIVACGNAE